MPTMEIKTIKPAGGGDYTSINDWNDAECDDLVSADKIAVAEVYGGGNFLDDTGISFSSANWTTDHSHYIEVRGATNFEHLGVWDESKAYGSANAEGLHGSINISNVSFRMSKILLKNTGGADRSVFYAGGASIDVIIDRCFMFPDSVISAFNTESNTGFFKITNSILIGKRGASLTSYVAASGAVYNSCLISTSMDVPNSSSLFINGDGKLISQNNYLKGGYNGCYYSLSAPGGQVIKGSNDATDTDEALNIDNRNIPYSTDTFVNIAAGSENLNLANIDTNVLYNGGADISSLGIIEDIRGIARPQFVLFDIGAFEYSGPTKRKFFPMFTQW